jgi:hypothetical protein
LPRYGRQDCRRVSQAYRVINRQLLWKHVLLRDDTRGPLENHTRLESLTFVDLYAMLVLYACALCLCSFPRLLNTNRHLMRTATRGPRLYPRILSIREYLHVAYSAPTPAATNTRIVEPKEFDSPRVFNKRLISPERYQTFFEQRENLVATRWKNNPPVRRSVTR